MADYLISLSDDVEFTAEELRLILTGESPTALEEEMILSITLANEASEDAQHKVEEDMEIQNEIKNSEESEK